MSYLNTRKSIKKNKRNDKMIIVHNLIHFLTQVNARDKFRKISSLNQAKDKMLSFNNYNFNNNYNNNYNGLNENIHIDYERKNKARRSLLFY